MGGVRRDLRIENEAKSLSLVRKVVSDVLESSAFTRDDRNKIILAVDEATANVVEHAYGSGTGPIEIVFELDDKRLVVRIRDNGAKFNSTEIPTPDIREHIAKGMKGGYGLFLMRKIMDEVRYSLESGWVNELILTKNLPQA